MTRPETVPPLVVMGVSGSGKSTTGAALAAEIGAPFFDADALHPERNKEKMRAGIPLTDEDRWPWLDLVGAALAERDDATGRAPVVACSSLKRLFRDRLRAVAPDAFFVFLRAPRDVLIERLTGRQHEYMPATLLDNQLATLEDLQSDEAGVAVEVDAPPAEIVVRVLAALR